MKTFLALLIAGGFATCLTGCRSRSEPKSVDADLKRVMELGQHWPLMRFTSLKGSGPVYFTTFGGTNRTIAKDLSRYYWDRLKLTGKALDPIPIPAAAINRSRGQAEDNVLLAELLKRYPREAKTCLIGITDKDMYSGDMDWQFAFSTRRSQPGGPCVAVVSIARMDPQFFGEPPDPDLTLARIRKMVTKNLGIIYFGLEPNNIQRSVLFSPILSLDDLDRMGQGF